MKMRYQTTVQRGPLHIVLSSCSSRSIFFITIVVKESRPTVWVPFRCVEYMDILSICPFILKILRTFVLNRYVLRERWKW